jgi:hypothetical protein
MPLLELIDEVQRVTGYPVVSRLARPGEMEKGCTSCLETGSPENPFHSLLIAESVVPFQRFQVGMQSLMILLKYHEGKTLELLPNPVKVSAMKKALTNGKTIESLEARVVPTLLQSLLEQLNSQPIEILSFYLIAKRCPELEGERRLALAELSKELVAGALNPVPMRLMVPPDIYNRNFAMNAALAWAIRDIAGDAQALDAFRLLGFDEQGRKLWSVLQVLSNDSSVRNFYRVAVDTWGRLLKMGDWYTWDSKPAKKNI